MEHHLQGEAESSYRAGGGERRRRAEPESTLTNRSSFHLNHHSWTLPCSSKNLEMGHAEKMLSKNSWGEQDGEGVMSRRGNTQEGTDGGQENTKKPKKNLLCRRVKLRHLS